MRLAIDVNYPDLSMGKLARRGLQIMVVAKSSQADDDWLLDAMAFDCEIVLSHDLDVPNWLDQNGYTDVLYFEKIDELIRWFDNRIRSKGDLTR